MSLKLYPFLPTDPVVEPIIYTSGSTGKPKGVMARHQNVVHFVNSFKQVCNLSSSDRLYNGFAYSFDGSVEEIWMAFSNGASLIVAPGETTKLASDAAKLINKEKITFLSTVPTFLNMIDEQIPSVKLMILSGEVCPPELVDKWAGNGCRMLNVYGPTETTVNTTSWECKPGAKVTIGKPIPGYPVYILDEDNKPISNGNKGELYIGGKGLAQGYLNQPELSRESFIEGIIDGEVLYKTGDLVSIDENEEIIFHGRIDSQVKVRGYRIELSEIESVIREYPNIKSVLVATTDKEGLKELVAYVVLKDKAFPLDSNALLSMFQERLPTYMIPSYLEIIDEMPLLTSGKIDRKMLPNPQTPLIKTGRRYSKPKDETQQLLVKVWEEVFQIEQVSIADDFFNDLGGHSLLAAKAVSILRNEYGIELAIRDIYLLPTIEKLSSTAEAKKRKTENHTEKKDINISPENNIAGFMKFLQAISMYVIYGFAVLPIAIPFYYYLKTNGMVISVNSIILLSLISLFLTYPVMLLLSIGLKWLIIGKIKPGKYPVYGFYYFRWWLSDRLQKIAGSALLAGSPLMSLYYRLMGAKIGKNCIIDTNLCAAWDLITIGNNTTIGYETQIMGCTIENGYLKIGKIDIGANCFIGIHSYVGIDTEMQDNSKLGDLSALQDGDELKGNESKQGSPAKNTDIIVPQGSRYKSKPVLWGIFHFNTLYFLIGFLVITGLPSVIIVIYGLISPFLALKIIALLISGPIAIISFCIFTAFIKRIIFFSVNQGTYKTESFFYLRKWFIDNIIRLSVTLIKPVYTTIYFPKWLRLLGAKVGKRAEISTVSQISPELMVIGDESFFADGSIIGGRHFYNGYMQISVTKIGRRSFIGNSAILPVGTSIGDECLIGVLSVPPVKSGTIENRTDWLGSPSFVLPARQKVTGFNDTVIYNPTLKLYILRYLIDSLRIFIPSTIGLLSVWSFILGTYFTFKTIGAVFTPLIIPLLSIAISIISSLLVVCVKWLLMGRIKPVIKPLWCTFVWFNEAVNGAYESVMAQALAPMVGTPFYTPFLRMMGCKIGKNVHMGTTLFSEFDLVRINDNVTLNAGVVIQNHLFEDRIMKASSLEIKDSCNIGNMAIVLYDSVIDSNTSLAPLSLVMKGEYLPKSSNWEGIPSERV